MSADLRLDRVVNLVREAGFAAYVEQTGGGTATIYASRKAESVLCDTCGHGSEIHNEFAVCCHEDCDCESFEGEALPILRPEVHDERFDIAAGPGWFEGPGFSDPRGCAEDFCVGPDGDEDAEYFVAGDDDASVAVRIVDLLKGLG